MALTPRVVQLRVASLRVRLTLTSQGLVATRGNVVSLVTKRWRRIASLAAALLFVVALLVAAEHHHGPYPGSHVACAVCLVAHHSQAPLVDVPSLQRADTHLWLSHPPAESVTAHPRRRSDCGRAPPLRVLA